MYVTEKNLRLQVKHLKSEIKDYASDLGGDIVYLNDKIDALDKKISDLIIAIEELKNDT